MKSFLFLLSSILIFLKHIMNAFKSFSIIISFISSHNIVLYVYAVISKAFLRKYNLDTFNKQNILAKYSQVAFLPFKPGFRDESQLYTRFFPRSSTPVMLM